MDATFKALTEGEQAEVDSSVTPDAASELDLNAIVARLDDIAARLAKIESAEKTEPWHDDLAKSGSGYTDEEIDGEGRPSESEDK